MDKNMANGISVLMSIYIRETASNLEESLKSIFDQTVIPQEVVLIEDGPLTKELYEVIEKYNEKYKQIVRYRFPQNVQLGNALRKGVELCRYDLVARMDSDDIALPNRLEIQYEFMNNHREITCCGGWIEEFGTRDHITKVKKMPCNDDEIAEYVKYRNPLNHMTVMFRKSKILAAGNYEHYPFLEDYYLWSRMLAKGDKFVNIPEVLVKARINENTYKRRGGFKYTVRFLQLRNKQRNLGILNWREYLKSIVLTLGFTLVPSSIRKKIYDRKLRENMVK